MLLCLKVQKNFSVNDESVDGIEGVLEILGTDLATDYTVCVEYTSVECPDPIVVHANKLLVDRFAFWR